MDWRKKMTIVTSKYRGTKEYALVYHELITAARYRGTVTYQEIARIMGLKLQGGHMARETGLILGEISEDEVSHGRPMLSAIAVGVEGHPGSGFFNLARDLGKLKAEDDIRKFWRKECQAVYEAWKAAV
jgi:hypothetical protein